MLGTIFIHSLKQWCLKTDKCTQNCYIADLAQVTFINPMNALHHFHSQFKVILYSYLILKKMNERITDS